MEENKPYLRLVSKNDNPIPDKQEPSYSEMAKSIAALYGDEGAIIISRSADGFRIGLHNWGGTDLREALNVAIHHSFNYEEMVNGDKQVLTIIE